MATVPSSDSTAPTLPALPAELKCMYDDCGNVWRPRTDRMPKVCPRCKRYGWETGSTRKRKGGKKNVKTKSGLGPATDQFLNTAKH